jgi:hypothetical protein
MTRPDKARDCAYRRGVPEAGHPVQLLCTRHLNARLIPQNLAQRTTRG